MKKIDRKHATSAVERIALQWLNEKGEDYESGPEGAAKDLFYGGCQSGMVSGLIYYSDTLKFYRKHRQTISEMLREAMQESGAKGPGDLFGDKWDDSDPLATETQNQNLLAWFAFEESARAVCNRAGIEV